jgi:hypothetical protein
MKTAKGFRRGGLVLLALLLCVGGYLYFSKTNSSRVVLADEAKENSIKLHNAMGEHACDCFQPWVSNVTISNITSTSFDVSWDCGTYTGGAGPATYQVTYGTTKAKSSIYPTAQPTVTFTKSSVTVPNLTPNTLYYVGVKSCCLSNCSRGGGPNMPKTFQQSPHVDEWQVTTKVLTSTYSISGKITAENGTGIAGVIVTLSGGSAKKDTTDAAGAFSITGLAAGTYTVTPSKTGQTFNPANKTYTLSANQTQNFVAAITTSVKQVAQRAAIMDAGATEITAKDVTVKWRTSIPATSMVEYGMDQNYGMNSGVITEMSYDHTLQLFQLQLGATYHARVVSFASDDPESKSYSQDFTFTLPAREDRIADKKFIINEPNPAASWTMFSYFLYQPVKSVNIDVLTISGKLVAHLESPSSSLAEGWNKVRWDNINLRNGLYVYKMTFKTANNVKETIQCSSLRIQK